MKMNLGFNFCSCKGLVADAQDLFLIKRNDM